MGRSLFAWLAPSIKILDPRHERLSRYDEAHNKPVRAGHRVEGCRVGDDADLVNESLGEIAICKTLRNLQDGGPASLDGQTGQVRSLGESRKVLADSGENLALHRFPASQPLGKRVLNWRVHGKKGVGNDFEASERFFAKGIWTEAGEPANLHLRERCNLRNT